MASTYSTNLAIELIGTGDQAGSWGNTTNTNLGTLIEQAISGYVTQAVSTGTDTTITIPNGATGVARNMYIELTGTGGTNTNLIVPANKKLYFIFNNSTGAVTVKVSGQTGVSVPQGKKVVLTSNGTDIVNGLNYIADFGSNSATITQLTATSATITNLTLTSLVISNLSIASANITTLTSASATITNLLATTLTVSGGTANGVLYLNGSKVATSGSALTFNGTLLTNRPTSDSNTNIARFGVINSAGTDDAFLNISADAANNLVTLDSTGNNTGAIAFSTGGGEKMRLTSAGDLGIGTTSPTFGLGTGVQIAGAGYASLSLKKGSAGTGHAIDMVDSSNTLQFRIGTNFAGGGNNLLFAYGTTPTIGMTMDTSGNLGIGVTPSAWSGRTAIQLPDNAYVVSSGPTVLLGANVYFNGVNRTYISNGVATDYRQINGEHRWEYAASGTAGGTISFTQAMTLDTSGNLGIGTASPGAKLHVVSSGSEVSRFATTGADMYLRFVNNFDTNGYIGYQNAALTFWTANTLRATLDSSGNLGLGVTPSAWTTYTALQIKNGSVANYSPTQDLRITANAYYDSGNWKYIASAYALQNIFDGGAGAFRWMVAASGSAGANTTNSTNAAGNEVMTLSASGNLLVGANSGSEAIEATRGGGTSAGLVLNQTGTSGRKYIISSTGTGYGSAGNLIFYDATAAAERARITAAGGFAVGTTTDPGAGNIGLAAGKYLGYSSTAYMTPEDNVSGARISSPGVVSFWTGATPAERARITSGGDFTLNSVGTSGTRTLTVQTNTSGDPTLVLSAAGADTGQFWFERSTLRLYARASNTGGVYLASGGTSWTAVSDERKKDIIEPISNAAEKVASLRAVVGKYKTDQDGVRRSFLIAQDVQTVFPEAVDASDENELGLSYTDTIPLLVAAIKELKVELDAAKVKIAALEAK